MDRKLHHYGALSLVIQGLLDELTLTDHVSELAIDKHIYRSVANRIGIQYDRLTLPEKNVYASQVDTMVMLLSTLCVICIPSFEDFDLLFTCNHDGLTYRPVFKYGSHPCELFYEERELDSMLKALLALQGDEYLIDHISRLPILDNLTRSQVVH